MKPTPPGETLLETIRAFGITQTELAEMIGRPKKTRLYLARKKS